jgi:hypothetical protein
MRISIDGVDGRVTKTAAERRNFRYRRHLRLHSQGEDLDDKKKVAAEVDGFGSGVDSFSMRVGLKTTSPF